MARRANAVPFTITAAEDEPGEQSCGWVAQRDRILESTRVFESQGPQSLGSSLNGNGRSHGPSTSPDNVAYAPVSIDDGDEEDGPRVKTE